MKKPLKKTKSRKAFQDFFEKTDLGDYLEPKDLKPFQLHLRSQNRLISFRLSSDLLHMLKQAAEKHHTKYQKLIRSILEENISHYLG